MNEYGFSNGGIARNASESAYPGLWRRLVGLWDPGAGVQGQRLIGLSGPNGAASGGPSWTPGRRGPALKFNGSSQYVEIARPPVIVTPLTLMGWVRLDSTSGSQVLLCISGNGRGPGWWAIGHNGGDAKAATVNGGSFAEAFGGAGTVPVGVWTHVCGVFASASSRAIYINGTLRGTNSSTLTPDTISLCRIGRLNDSGDTEYLAGSAADLRIYSRALSAQEIMQSFQGASPLVRRRRVVSFAPAASSFVPAPYFYRLLQAA